MRLLLAAQIFLLLTSGVATVTADRVVVANRRAARRRVRPGGAIMIHGLPNGLGALGAVHTARDWTAGCIAVTNDEIDEIWRLVPNGTRIEIRP